MASILQTDVLELYNSWGERVAFNEGFQAQKIADAKQAGRDAFSLGIDRSQGRDLYFEAKDERFSEAKEFLAGESAAQISDSEISDVEPESIEPDQIGDVTDGEETLGMESVVANETEDLDDGRSWYDEAMEDHAESVLAEYNSVSAYDWANAHRMNREFDSLG